jgi:porin
MLAPTHAHAEDPTTGPTHGIKETQPAGLLGDPFAIRSSLYAAGIKVTLEEQSELWGNVMGGLRRGATVDGLTTASVTFDMEKIIGWKGGQIYADAFQIHGTGPSAQLAGNQQSMSNIEAFDGVKLYHLYLEQSAFNDSLNVRIGQEGANDEMMYITSSTLFLNSSFGYPDPLVQNLPGGGPNYPVATPMVRAKLVADPTLTLVGAIFNGDPAPPGPGNPQDRDKYGVAFRLDAPPLTFAEAWFTLDDKHDPLHMPGTYKLGWWHHNGSFDLFPSSPAGLPASHSVRGDDAFYASADQMIWRKEPGGEAGLNIFGLVMVQPEDRNLENVYVEAGLNGKGLVSGRPDDMMGIAVSYAGTSPKARAAQPWLRSDETIFEGTYLYQVMPSFSLQPDVQYVLHPGAVTQTADSKPLHDALVFGVRSRIDF